MAANRDSPFEGHDGDESSAENLTETQREAVLLLARENGVEGPVPIYSIAADVLADSRRDVVDGDEFLDRCREWSEYQHTPERFVEIDVDVPAEVEAAVEEQLYLEGRAGDDERREQLILDRLQIVLE